MRRPPVLAPVVLALVLGTAMASDGGQAPASPEPAATDVVESDSDPTRPVFFSIRPEFYSVRDEVEQRTVIFRYDAAVLKTQLVPRGMPGVILRLELPAVGAEATRQFGAGLGDAYGQLLIVPYTTPKFAWVIGSGLVLPTASDDLTGNGKWALAPITAPLWRFPRGLFFIKFQNFTSVAGDTSRPDFNYLLITPTFIRLVARQFWVLADSETMTNWTDGGRTGIKSGLQIGCRIVVGVGLWVKPEVWWGPNRNGEWNLKFGLVWYQRRAQANRS